MKRALLVLVVALAGCYWRAAKEPMPVERFVARGPGEAKGVVVLLPGFGDEPEDFDEQGFVRVLRAQAPLYDVVAADAHFGYYRKATLMDQLHAHVVGPLVAQGYREIWLAGVSMGGHGAVAYVRAHPERIRGLLLFAPYLAAKETIEEVSRAGGLCPWQPPTPLGEGRVGFARANLAWLKQDLCGGTPPVAIFLGIGDQALGASGLITAKLPADHVVVRPGGHGWQVWTPALETILPRALLPAAR